MEHYLHQEQTKMKKKTSVCVTPELFKELRRLNQKYNVSMSAMMEQ